MTTTTVDARDLTIALRRVSRAISKRTTLPILSHVRIDNDDPELIALQATDLEIGIRTTVPIVSGHLLEPITVPAADLLAFAKTAPKGTDVSISADGTVETDASTVTLPTIDPDEYPVTPYGALDGAMVDGSAFALACKRAYVTAASDAARPILTGALLRSVPDGIVIVTADNYRIGESLLMAHGADEWPDMVVPARALKVWAMIAPKADTVWIDPQPNSNQVRLQAEGISLTTRMIDGQFPRYESVMPASKATTTAATFDTAPALAAVESIAPIAKQGTNVSRFYVNGSISLRASVPSGAESSVAVVALAEIPATTSGDEIHTAYNVSYLRDMLKIMGPRVQGYFSGPLSPGLFVDRDMRVGSYRQVVMPVRMPA
jgi:DNA polymerase-3 subunit beta